MPRRVLLLTGLFFVSGASGLIYEVLWTRQLSLIFGVTTYAVSAVLATYMGGLALGSFWFGRRVEKFSNPLRLYALLEAGIGLYALVVPLLLHGLRPLYIALAQLGLPYATFSLARTLLASGVLLVPTTLMGGTYPVLVHYWTTTGRGLHRGAGVLYFVNTAGAILGCALTGFWLIEHFGLTGTTRIAAVSNLLLAAGAAAIAGRAQASGEIAPVRSDSPKIEETAFSRLILLCAGISGFVSLAAEVLWSRALLRYLYNSTYAFTSMLSAFLLGIALGSAVYTTMLAHRRRPLLVLAALQTGVAAGFVVTILAFPSLREWTDWMVGSGIVTTFEDSLRMMMLRAVLVLLPPVVFLGAIFPLTASVYASGRDDVGSSVGRVYAANTLGAIVGSIACSFLLVPVIGMWGTQRLLIALCLVPAGLVASVALPRAKAAVLAATVVAAAAALFVPAGDVFRDTFLQGRPGVLDFYREGSTDTVGVGNAFGQRTIVYEDQRGTASTMSFGVNFFLGHLPMLLHPGTPKRVLHICFGVGNSLSAVASHTELERVDNVELSPHVLEAGHLFWTNDDVLSNPKVHTIIDDGRNYLMTTNQMYDVILLEPPETFTAGVINLYTVEFYRDALAHLAPDGLMMQWIPTGNGTMNEEKELFAAFAAVFPHQSMWWQLGSGCALLVGSRQPLAIDYSRLREHMKEPRVHRDMTLSQVRDVDQLLSMFLFDDVAFADFVRGVAPTRDDRTVLDFTMPRYAGSGFGLGQFSSDAKAGGDKQKTPFWFVLTRLAEYRKLGRPVVPYLTNLGGEDPAAIAARIERARFTPRRTLALSEPEWQRMRSDGSLPQRWVEALRAPAVVPAVSSEGAPAAPH